MKAHQAEHSVALMCRTLHISRSGYYAWLKRPPSRRSRRDGDLRQQVRSIHSKSRGTYGVPRIHAQLRVDGVRIARKRVAKMMREAGIKGVSRRRYVVTTVKGDNPAPPDLVKRAFRAAAPNQLWVADITYVPTYAGFLYLAVVLDVWSRRIVGWAMRTHLRTELVLEAMEMALQGRQPQTGLVHHSDRGCQYTSIAFGKRCQVAGVQPSVGTVGDSYDNAMAESFFATLECELIDRKRFKNPIEARAEVFDFIEGFYNPRRLHSALGYRSPVHFEAQEWPCAPNAQEVA